jgi:hypothetical protein
MKTLRLKAMMVTGMVGLMAVTGFANVKGPVPSGKYAKEEMAIRQDLSRITDHREGIRFLKNKLKEDRSAGSKMAVVTDKTDLKKVKADLKRDMAFLRADRCDLKKDHKLAINERKQAIREDKKNIAKHYGRFHKNSRNESDPTLTAYQNNLDRDRELLKKEKSEMNSDMVAVNKEIKDSMKEMRTAGNTSEKNCTYCKK